MSEQPDDDHSLGMDEVNADLKRGLKMCHSVIDDFRLKLAANSNETEADHEKRDENRLG